uniref:Uncharacterized protein n=1 Tax=Florenciella sp. virus SA2 TaxID=3240092 RepID=A0AB39JF88_9VIRU
MASNKIVISCNPPGYDVSNNISIQNNKMVKDLYNNIDEKIVLRKWWIRGGVATGVLFIIMFFLNYKYARNTKIGDARNTRIEGLLLVYLLIILLTLDITNYDPDKSRINLITILVYVGIIFSFYALRCSIHTNYFKRTFTSIMFLWFIVGGFIVALITMSNQQQSSNYNIFAILTVFVLNWFIMPKIFPIPYNIDKLNIDNKLFNIIIFGGLVCAIFLIIYAFISVFRAGR